VHLACQSLQDDECQMAIAGGVNVILTDTLQAFYEKAGLYSKDGKCRPFGSHSTGIIRSEGAGAIILKKLSHAIDDGDRIYAVIKASAVNHDGKSNGITAPSKWSQKAVIRKAMHQAGILPHEIDYIEAHGTGTALGDPIEANALGEIMRETRSADKPCFIGSVKGNMGHLEGAAGIAGLIKIVLSVYKNRVFPSINYGQGNKFIKFQELKLQVPLTSSKNCHIAGVSSFGLGGTNAHIIVACLDKTESDDHALHQVFKIFGGESYWYDKSKINSTLILSLVSETCGITADQIRLSSNFRDELGFDSLMMVELKTKIQKNFVHTDRLNMENFLGLKDVNNLISVLGVSYEKF